MIINKLKEKLNNQTWVIENLQSKKDCFDKDIPNPTQKLNFIMANDNKNYPIAIVTGYSEEEFVVSAYKDITMAMILLLKKSEQLDIQDTQWDILLIWSKD